MSALPSIPKPLRLLPRTAVPLISSLAFSAFFLAVWSVARGVPEALQLGALGWISLTAVGGLVLYPVLTRVGRGLDLFEPILPVSLLFLVLFWIRPLQILANPPAADGLMPYNSALFEQALFYAAVGYASLYLGYSIHGLRSLAARLPKFTGLWRAERLLLVAIVYTIFGMVGFGIAIMGAGGPSRFLGNLQGRRTLGETGQWFFASWYILVVVAGTLLYAHYLKAHRLASATALCLASSLALTLPLGGRSAVLTPLLALMIMYYYLRADLGRRRVRTIFLILALALGLLLILVTVGTLRQYTAQEAAFPDVGSLVGMVSSDLGQRVMGEFQQFDWLVIALDLCPSQLPFQYGRTFLDFFALFVPRALWPGKPQPIAVQTNILAGGPGIGTPSSIIGEMYINGGFAGILLGMALIGMLLRAAYAYLEANRGNPAVVLLYAHLVAYLPDLLTRSFAPRFFGFTLFLAPAVVGLWFVANSCGRLLRPVEE